MDDLVAIGGVIEKQALAPSGINMELVMEDLQKRTKAYKEDKGHVAAFTKLC